MPTDKKPKSKTVGDLLVNPIKFLKLLVFFLILMVQGLTNVFASDRILDFEGERYSVRLEFNKDSKRVTLKYKRKSNWGNYTSYGPLSVETPSQVDIALNMLESLFERQVFATATRDKIKERIHEFKFLSSHECQALHFSPDSDLLSTEAITSLMAEVEKIRLAQNPGGDAFRSLFVREFETSEDGKIQLRMVLDREGNFLKFSFAKENGNLSNFTWSQKEGVINLKNPKGDIILQVDFNNFQKEGGLLIVKHPRKTGVEQATRSYLRFSRAPASSEEDTSWEVKPYTTQHFQNTVIKDGVALTSTMADHTAVIQLNNSEIAFHRFDLEEIKSTRFFSQLGDEDLRKVETYYNQCMGERLSFLFEEQQSTGQDANGKDSEEINLCKRNALLEGISISMEHKLETYQAKGDYLEEVNEALRECLVRHNVGRMNENVFSFDYDALSSITDETMAQVLTDCHGESERKLVRSIARERVFEDPDMKQRMADDRTFELLWTTVSNQLDVECLNVVPAKDISTCLDFSKILSDQNFYLAEISSHLSQLYEGDVQRYGEQRLQMVQNYENCRQEHQSEMTRLIREGLLSGESLDDIKEKELGCAKKTAQSLAMINVEPIFSRALGRSGLDTQKLLTGAEFEESKTHFNDCLVSQMEDEGAVGALIHRLSFYQEACLTESLKPIVEKEVLKDFENLISTFDFLQNDEQRSQSNERMRAKISSKLDEWQEIESLEGLKDELLPDFYGAVLKEHFEAARDNLLGSDEVELASELEEVLERLVSDTSSKPLSLKLKGYFREIVRNSERGDRPKEEYLRVALNEIMKEFHLGLGPILTKKEISAEVLLESDAESYGNIVNEAFSDCLRDYSPNSSVAFKRKYQECEKKRLAKVSLQLTRRKLEQRVASLFPLTSQKANRVLTPVQYLELCYENVDPYNSRTIGEYKKLIEGCERIAELDISYNLSVAKVDGYLPLLSRKGYHDAVTAYCYNIIFHHMDGENFESHIPRVEDVEGSHRSLTEMQQSQRRRSPYSGSLLRYFSKSQISDPEFADSDQKQILGLVKTFAANDELNEEWWGEKLAQCEKGTNDFVLVSFRQFVIESIPALSWTDSEDANEKVMRDFLDFELVQGLLDYKKAFEDQHGQHSSDLGNVVPSERTVNPDLGVTALTNFIQILGGYISRGFVYDEAAMRTELIVFQSELKAFLSWSSRNPEAISIREARDFFSESKLAEHLSMAVVSESTFLKFKQGLQAMEQDELGDFLRVKGCRFVSCLSAGDLQKYRDIEARYDRLENLLKEMTSSYDFRRIIRPESNEGKEIISAIKDTYLMPKILGEEVSPQAEERIMELIGEAILRDNTDGGFAERFAHEAAQFALDKEADRRWGITKWLFYDSKDFDWDTLKKTESGRKAVNYYARQIMLPRLLGKQLSDYYFDVRMDAFRRMITDAQGENSD